jgi:hypothetical protein
MQADGVSGPAVSDASAWWRNQRFLTHLLNPHYHTVTKRQIGADQIMSLRSFIVIRTPILRRCVHC